MAQRRTCGEQIIWRRLTRFEHVDRLRDALCDLLCDCAPETVVSVLLFVDELCTAASARQDFPIEVCVVRGTDPHYLRIDIDGPMLDTPSRPGFMDDGSAGWGVTYREQGMSVWAYLSLAAPAGNGSGAPWRQLAMSLPANPTLN